jgi:hypothetical protein
VINPVRRIDEMAKSVKEANKNLPAKRSKFAADAGGGMEEATADSFSIPFLSVLQKGSPQVDDASGQAIKGAKAGMLYDNVSKTLFDGNKGVDLVQAHYKRVWLRWGARDAGGGFKGEIAPEMLAQMRADNQIVDVKGITLIADKNGEVDLDESDRVIDTRVHYMLIVDRKKRTSKRCVLSLSRTQVRKSKLLMSQFAEYRAEEDGEEYNPATYQHIINVTTVPEKNDQGTWYGVDFKLVELIDDPNDALYLAAKQFKEAVKSGVASAKMGDDGTE